MLMPRRLVLALFAVAVVAEDVGYEKFFQSSSAEVWPAQCFDAPGIPAHVQGTYLLGGPALFEMGGRAFQSALDGFGKVHSFKVGGAKVCFSTRMMQTGFYNASVKAGTIGHGGLFLETVPPRSCEPFHPLCNMKAAGDNNFVNSFQVSPDEPNKLLMVSDTTKMVDFDLESLSVTGDHSWDDHMVQFMHTAALGSAHPLPDPAGRGGTIGIAISSPEGPGKSFVDVYRLDPAKSKTRELLSRYSVDKTPYFHSFGLTKHYAIFPHNLAFDAMAMLKTFGATIGNALIGHWDGIQVAQHNPASVDKEPLIFQTEPFFHVHIANSFENATGIVLDISSTSSDPFTTSLTIANQMNKTIRDSSDKILMKRLHLHLSGDQKGKVTTQTLSVESRSTEFPRINPLFQSKEYCIYYASEWFHAGRGYASMAVLRHDVCKGERTYWAKENWYPSEATFVPTGTEEADGVLCFTALDGVTGVSHFITVDAATMTEVANVALPVRIPFTAHGEFYTGAGAAESLATESTLLV
jgi:carotenoid cleavage dioxygenase-like enzyme